MILELTRAAEVLGADRAVRAVVLAANGKSFCAGGDLGWMQDQAKKDRAGKMGESRALTTLLAALNALPKPLVARIQGPAYGGGVGLISVCDIAIAVDGTKFGLTETRLGLIPATIGPFLVARMGAGFARQVFFTGKGFSTDFALRAGLVSRVCDVSGLEDFVEEELHAILQCAPAAVERAKALCQLLGGADPAEFANMTANALADCGETDEAEEGIAAFFSKETPNWAR